MNKYELATNKDGSVRITDGEVVYSFHEPLGSDLVSLDRLMGAAGTELTDTERLAMVMEVLSDDCLKSAEFLALRVALFKYIGKQIDLFFQS